MDLTTTYLGLQLRNPLIVAASPFSAKLDTAKELEARGAAALVMYSLFEEQILHESRELDAYLTQGTESFAEALTYFPEPDHYENANGEEYLDQIRRLKQAVSIPVIASLNGVSSGGWMSFAKKIEQAGADALELNIYYIPTDPTQTSAQIEQMYLTNIAVVKGHIKIPVAVKLSPYFTALANLAVRLSEAQADGLVLFNRFYQPDINLDKLEIRPDLEFSTPYELRLPIRWLAILYGKVKCSLAASSGVHSAEDVIKSVMAGADAAMMASVLMQKGVKRLERILEDLGQWMEMHEYESITQMKGSMSYKSVAEPAAYERANYMKTLQSIRF
jgi:dihydroorotate dehydrogenase (fumarate)